MTVYQRLGNAVKAQLCGEIYANAVFFRMGVMAYNLFLAMKLLSLPKGWHRHTVGTVRWRLYQIAGRVVWEARRAVLMLATTVEKILVLLGARRRIRKMAVT